MAMYNQFILEELKTLKDLLEAGAITQGEFDHLKQILIDGTKASSESPETVTNEQMTSGDVYENPDEVIRYYTNETKNLLLYKQFDKAYPFVQKILSLRPDHREATRFLQEIKTYIRRDYLIGGAIGVILACVLSYVFTISKNVNFIFLCMIPVLAGIIIPRISSNLLIGKVGSRGMRYFIAGLSVIMVGCIFNLALANVLVEWEGKLIQGSNAPIAEFDTTQIYQSNELFTGVSDNAGNNTVTDTASNWDTQSQSSTSVLPTESQTTDPQENTPQNTGVKVAEEDNKNTELRKILASYYKDLSSQQFDANKYYASEVNRFFNLRDITPQKITREVQDNYYTDFQNAVSTIDQKTMKISPVSGGKYQVDFREIVRCHRKSVNRNQTIVARVKIVFDKHMKIIYHFSEPVSTKDFGDRSVDKRMSKVVSFQEEESPDNP